MGKGRTAALLLLAILVASCVWSFGLDSLHPTSHYAQKRRSIEQGFSPVLASEHKSTKTAAKLETTAASARDLSQTVRAQVGRAQVSHLKFTHLTTNDGLSQGYVTAIIQDRRGFMWFATRDGLNRYDGNTFVVYKNDPNDPNTLSSNFIQGLTEDNQGYLWLATNAGADRFDPTTERCTRYVHEPNNPNSIGGTSVKSVAQDNRGRLWFGTEDNGLEKFDPASETFIHFRNDHDGKF